MKSFHNKKQPSPAQLKRLLKHAAFAFAEQERMEAPDPVVPEREALEQPEVIDDDLPIQFVTDRDTDPLPRASQAATFSITQERISYAQQADEMVMESEYPRLLEQLQEEIKLIRREQEYLLNVTESSQAFLETLSRELLSVLELLGQGKEGVAS